MKYFKWFVTYMIGFLIFSAMIFMFQGDYKQMLIRIGFMFSCAVVHCMMKLEQY